MEGLTALPLPPEKIVLGCSSRPPKNVDVMFSLRACWSCGPLSLRWVQVDDSKPSQQPLRSHPAAVWALF